MPNILAGSARAGIVSLLHGKFRFFSKESTLFRFDDIAQVFLGIRIHDGEEASDATPYDEARRGQVTALVCEAPSPL